MEPDRPLDGCRVVVTRDEPGELGGLLELGGADVIHVPLIEIIDPDDGGQERDDALSVLDEVDWLIVTSPAGADRVGVAAADHPHVRLAAVGTATARRLGELAGRSVDLVPDRQLAEALAVAFLDANPVAGQRVLLALADRAGRVLVDSLSAAGHQVSSVVAYQTVFRAPSDAELQGVSDANAVLFASGSAAESWAVSMGAEAATRLPELAIAIGPTTAAKAREFGLKISSVAADHSLAGLVEELAVRWRELGRP